MAFLRARPGILTSPFHARLLPPLLGRAVLVEIVELAAGELYGVDPLAVLFLLRPIDRQLLRFLPRMSLALFIVVTPRRRPPRPRLVDGNDE